MRSLSFVIALFLFASSAHAQTRSVIVKNTPDGFVLTSVPNAPVTDAPAVLLTAGADGSEGWTLRVLSPIENPSDILASRGTPGHAQRMEALGTLRRSRMTKRGDRAARGAAIEIMRDRDVVGDGEIIERMDVIGDGEIIEERARGVYYEVSAQMKRGFELADPMMDRLSDAPALHELTLQTDGTYATVEARFRFDSLDTLNAWREAGTFETLRVKARSVSETVSVR